MTIKIRTLGFGVQDRLTCSDCRGVLDLRRRTPDPLHGIDCELQTFRCRACGREMVRSVDSLGLPPLPSTG